MKKIALLSNVNMNFVIRMLQKELDVYETEGYGNELGILMNRSSSYYAFKPEITFVVMDLLELLAHDTNPAAAQERIGSWFDMLESCLGTGVFYISDACLWGVELEAVLDDAETLKLEWLWQERLERLCASHENVRILPYRRLIRQLGAKAAFSMKMWYMGKILLSSQAQQELCALILDSVELEGRVPKKVLLLDLDNTLWGGLAGETEHTPIVLSEEHTGLAYKNLQRVLLHMQRQGVLLAIVSKNNEEDAMEILCKHPHMVLRPECFAAKKINWKQKHENIQELSAELNLGLDSFVFFDDNPTERQLVKELLPMVEVPEFPDKPEQLAFAMLEINKRFFAKAAVTAEDLEKTGQYAANAKRNELKKSAGSFEEYLKQLDIVVESVEAQNQIERLLQLVNKTNQFNLTTKRYTRKQLEEVLVDAGRRVYLYRVSDRFGDNGVVAAVIVRLDKKEAETEEFVMSCRVMGKNIEYAVLGQVEQRLAAEGVERLRGIYLPTAKNKPVEWFYEQAGYSRLKENVYELVLAEAPKRMYFAKIKCYDSQPDIDMQ